MPTALFSHAECNLHDAGADHPECPARLAAISDRLLASGLGNVLMNFDAPEVTLVLKLRKRIERMMDQRLPSFRQASWSTWRIIDFR